MRWPEHPAERVVRSLSSCTVQVRIADNVLDAEEWPVWEIEIRDGRLHEIDRIRGGVYGDLGLALGATVDDLVAWTQHDGTGSHPETYHQLRVASCSPLYGEGWRSHWSMEDLAAAVRSRQAGQWVGLDYFPGSDEGLTL